MEQALSTIKQSKCASRPTVVVLVHGLQSQRLGSTGIHGLHVDSVAEGRAV
jgi:hypothetical protein